VSAPPRYRCTSCGNLTRFDVVSARRTRSYHHYSVGGELSIEDEIVLDEVVESVECRWCGPVGRVETLSSEDAAAETDPAGAESAAQG
jgi:hypothetical protein